MQNRNFKVMGISSIEQRIKIVNVENVINEGANGMKPLATDNVTMCTIVAK
jgi:hypothetical protein